MTTGPRHQAREAALQALYFWEVGGAEPERACDLFFAEHLPDASDAVKAFTREIVLGTAARVAELDPIIEQHSQHWRLARIAVIDRLILRMALWEFLHHPDTPVPVVLDEAIELARTFSTDESARFVNGVLDGIRKDLGNINPGP